MNVRLSFGRLTLIDLDVTLFRLDDQDEDDFPPQLAGGQGSVVYPDDPAELPFGFGR